LQTLIQQEIKLLLLRQGKYGGIIMGNKFLDGTALTIAIIGAINWALIGLFRFDLVAFIFGNMSWLSRIVYAIVGLCGLYLISFFMHLGDRTEA
jgi:hypothetical protein